MLTKNMLERWSIRRRQFDGTAETLDALYSKPDPWGLGRKEHFRFEATNDLILANAGELDSILEIGCGEGYQTRYLRAIADHVSGLDISPTALARARRAVPRADFVEGTLPAARAALPRQRYDLVTLCEVLVYGTAPGDLLATAQQLADRVFVSSYAPQAHSVETLCAGAGWRELETIVDGRKRWRTFWWNKAG